MTRQYQLLIEGTLTARPTEARGWTIVRDAQAFYWRAYRTVPVTITLAGAHPADLARALHAVDLGLLATRERAATSADVELRNYEGARAWLDDGETIVYPEDEESWTEIRLPHAYHRVALGRALIESAMTCKENR